MGSSYMLWGTQIALWWDAQGSCQKRRDDVKVVSSATLKYLRSLSPGQSMEKETLISSNNNCGFQLICWEDRTDIGLWGSCHYSVAFVKIS